MKPEANGEAAEELARHCNCGGKAQLIPALKAALSRVASESRRAALVEAADYIATHYPVHVTNPPEPSKWIMEPTSDGGKTQSTYASAIRALAEEGDRG